MGQTNQRGTFLEGPNPDAVVVRPRRRELAHLDRRTAPHPTAHVGVREGGRTASTTFPPEPVGQVRVRLLTDTICADLRGPTACEVLDPAQVEAVVAKLGPDPLVDAGPEAEERFTARRPQEADADRPAAHGPGRRGRHRQRLPRGAAVPRPAEPAHPGQGRARGARARTSGATGRSCSRSASRPAR